MSYYDTSTSFGNYLASNPGNGDTWAYVDSYLNDAGLGGLTQWAQDLLVEQGANLTDDQFRQRIRETDVYKTRFRAIEMARQNGMPVPSEKDVLDNEKAYASIAQQAGLPKSFYDSPDDYANLIARGVSPSEYQDRVISGFTAVRNNPMIQAQLGNLYGTGLSESDLVAFYLDPDVALSAIQKKQSAATIAAKGTSSGFGQLSVTQAEQLAGQGVTESQAQQGFAKLAQQRSLLSPLVGSEQGNISTDTALSATFEDNAAAKSELDRRRSERQSKFSGGGSYQTNKDGRSGIGSA